MPRHGGGLFVTVPDESDEREQRTARFLIENKVPDLFLASAIDALARGIDYQSLEVRHLGSIYEGLLEFKLRVSEEEAVVAGGQVYLSNDNAERKASGSYYTPDVIVKYIVEQTVGPVLCEKLESLQAEFAAAESDEALAKTFEQLFEFRVLDPAMGSGHFLVAAADFITRPTTGLLKPVRGQTR